MAMVGSIPGFPGGEWLLASAVQPPVKAPSRWRARVVRLAAVGATGFFATLGCTVVKLAYYWPVLYADLTTQFTCLGGK